MAATAVRKIGGAGVVPKRNTKSSVWNEFGGVRSAEDDKVIGGEK